MSNIVDRPLFPYGIIPVNQNKNYNQMLYQNTTVPFDRCTIDNFNLVSINTHLTLHGIP